MREYRIDAAGVPGRVYEPSEPQGLLLLGHRGTHSKDDAFYVDLGRRLASECAVTVACIDAPCHGERTPSSGDPAADKAAVLEVIVSGEERIAADWEASAAVLAAFGPPIALIGFSMGALAGMVTAARLPSIRAIVLCAAGVPAFAVKDRRAEGSSTPQLRAAAALRQVEVLMLNTTHDDLIPPVGALELFEALPPSSKRLMLWEGDHDAVPPEMIHQAVEFLRHHIDNPAPTSV